MIDFIVTLALIAVVYYLGEKIYKLSTKLDNTIIYFTKLHEIIFNNINKIEDKLTDDVKTIDDLQESLFELEERLSELEKENNE